MSGTYALSSEFGLLADESDRRFRKLVLWFGLPALILGIVIPMIDLPSFVKQVITPQRYAKLIQQAPPPEEKKIEEKKAEPKPKPQLTPEQKLERARKRAEKQLATLRDSLADLRAADLPKVNQPLSANVITSSSANPSFASQATKGSSGIGEIGVVERGTTTGVGDRTTGRVTSSIGGKGDGFGGRGKPARSLEEIQLVFDRNKGAFYTMYVREQRQRPEMVGKLTVRMTIAPSGRVTACKVVASELNNPEFEKKVVARVLLMDFGAKNVGDFTLDYPILFFPS